MKKRIWGKRYLTLLMCALLIGENSEALAVQAEGLSDSSVIENVVSDGALGDAESEVSVFGDTEDSNSGETVGTESTGENDQNAGNSGNEGSTAEASSDEDNTSNGNTSTQNGEAATSDSTEGLTTDSAKDDDTNGNAVDQADDSDSSETDGNNSDENSEVVPDAGSEENVADADKDAVDAQSEEPVLSDDSALTEDEVSDDNTESDSEAANNTIVPDPLTTSADDGLADGFNYEESIEGYTIKLHAEEGAVPDGSSVQIKKVNKVGGQKTDDLVNAILPAESVVFDSASFDITFLNEGKEIEPEDKVSVEITLNDELSKKNGENDSTEIQVFHIEDDATTTLVSSNVTENATDVYSDCKETVVSYDADSFSVYDVSVVVNFETSEPFAAENDVYKDFIAVSDEQLEALAAELDSTEGLKTLMASGGSCTSIQEMAEVARNTVKSRVKSVNIGFKLPGYYTRDLIYEELMPIMIEHTGVPNEGDYVRWAYVMHSYQASTASVGGATYGNFMLTFGYTDDANMEAQATAAINELIQTNGWANLPSDKAKVDAVYKWITTNVIYEPNYQLLTVLEDYTMHSCYSAIVKRRTVCQGYSMLFYRIMLILGIDSRLIAGYAEAGDKNSGHGWNIVQLGNIYYYADTTWDAANGGTAKTKYYLQGSGVLFDSTEHERWPQYNNDEFNKIYPISTTAYVSTPSYVKPTGVTISQTSATIGVGASLQLSAACVPANATQGIRWNSNDLSVATVSATGLVTGLKNGECEIFATSEYGGKKASCRILVTDGKIKAIEAVTKSITVKAGSTAAISLSLFPEWCAGEGVNYRSSNKSIATVSKDGIVKGKKVGKCSIICTTKDGTASTTISVNVKKAKRVKKIALSKKKIKMKVGRSLKLKVKFTPKKASNKKVTWKSSKPGVVSVDANGNIVALKKGKAKITAISEDGKKKASCTVKVK